MIFVGGISESRRILMDFIKLDTKTAPLLAGFPNYATKA